MLSGTLFGMSHIVIKGRSSSLMDYYRLLFFACRKRLVPMGSNTEHDHQHHTGGNGTDDAIEPCAARLGILLMRFHTLHQTLAQVGGHRRHVGVLSPESLAQVAIFICCHIFSSCLYSLRRIR